MLKVHSNWWSRLLGVFENSLGESGEQCIWCGRRRRGGNGQQERSGQKGGNGRKNGAVVRYPQEVFDRLCEECWAGVPWIERAVCGVCGRAEACPDCARRKVSFLAASRSAVQYTPLMKEWLARYKYRGSERLGPLFAEMACFAYERLRASWSDAGMRTLLTYVPLSERRLEERGFNQAEAMARGVGRRFSLPVTPLLVRTRHTEKQSYKSRQERLSSLDRAFAVREDAAAKLRRLSSVHRPLRLVIVDDVYTTGSTLQHCGSVLTNAFGGDTVVIYGLTWARG